MTRSAICLCVASTTLATAAIMLGCGGGSDGPPRYDVSGSVTFEGKPVPRGTIQFRPDASKGNSGPAANADIVDGKYDTSQQGTGNVGGPHVVIIQGFDGNAKPEEELLLGVALFDEYTTDADMPQSTGATLDFVVAPK